MLVGFVCHVRYRIADLINLVSIPRLIDFTFYNLHIILFPAVHVHSFFCCRY